MIYSSEDLLSVDLKKLNEKLIFFSFYVILYLYKIVTIN